MGKYLLNRVLRGIISIIAVVAIIMVMVYSLLDRNLIFATDSTITHLNNNTKTTYKYQKWEDYGYLDYVTYTDYLNMLVSEGEITDAKKAEVSEIGKTTSDDTKAAKEYIKRFEEYYASKGYKVERLPAVMSGKRVADGGLPQLFAHRDLPLLSRLGSYFGGLIKIDSVRYAQGDVGQRGISFTLKDPVYGGEKFSPALIGNGTLNKYLIYCDNHFPFVHQNIISISLGQSYTINKGIDVFDTMTTSQGSYVLSEMTFPTGLTEMSADDLHTAKYIMNSRASSKMLQERFVDDYTNVATTKNGLSKMGYSFVIGIIATFMAYMLGVPLGIITARNKDKLIDKIATLYVIFIIAVPSLAYIFLFKSIGQKSGLPAVFDVDSPSKLVFVLPIISLALPSIANLMKWIRRYMIDQMNSDYVKFARSGGLTENEIFFKHILKNAIIPIVHGIPGSVLGALTGAIITERVYVVPGAGNLLTNAINKYDNGVIVGVSLFYASLSVISIILGDILMSMVDPRISFTTKAR